LQRSSKGVSAADRISGADTVDICRSITKYAVTVRDPYTIRYELHKAVAIAKSGRPGPVLVDIPDDLQRMEIDPAKLIEYEPAPALPQHQDVDTAVQACLEEVGKAQRPVLIYGWGVHLAKAEAEARELAHLLGVPVAMTWAALDLFPYEDSLAIGGFGTHGVRYANFAVQNADLIISIGSRLDTKATGSPPSTFAREAKIVMLDIDPAEIRKFERLGRRIDFGINEDARIFLRAMIHHARSQRFPSFATWIERIRNWKARYPACLPESAGDTSVNPYWFVKQFSVLLPEDEIIFSDTGFAVAWMMQGFEFKKGQRFSMRSTIPLWDMGSQGPSGQASRGRGSASSW
jgi:acetolactate synthase-1/2/3 large subunit